MNPCKLTISLDSKLIDSLSDFLIGIHGAAIESKTADEGESALLQVFVDTNSSSPFEVKSMVEQVRAYGIELAQIFSCAPPRVAVEVLEDQDWSEAWKVHFKPFAIIPGLVIAPTWEQYEPCEDEQVIVMDPGMAFGTGHHETTRLCLGLLRESEAITSGGLMLDVGTGTGILSMAASLFGARNVVAIDTDPEALKAASTNTDLNGFSGRIEISGQNLRTIHTTFDLVVANIVHDVLWELSDELARVVRGGGTLLLSGLILGSQSINITHCFSDKGFQLVDQRVDGQWCALVLQKSE